MLMRRPASIGCPELRWLGRGQGWSGPRASAHPGLQPSSSRGRARGRRLALAAQLLVARRANGSEGGWPQLARNVIADRMHPDDRGHNTLPDWGRVHRRHLAGRLLGDEPVSWARASALARMTSESRGSAGGTSVPGVSRRILRMRICFTAVFFLRGRGPTSGWPWPISSVRGAAWSRHRQDE